MRMRLIPPILLLDHINPHPIHPNYCLTHFRPGIMLCCSSSNPMGSAQFSAPLSLIIYAVTKSEQKTIESKARASASGNQIATTSVRPCWGSTPQHTSLCDKIQGRGAHDYFLSPPQFAQTSISTLTNIPSPCLSIPLFLPFLLSTAAFIRGLLSPQLFIPQKTPPQSSFFCGFLGKEGVLQALLLLWSHPVGEFQAHHFQEKKSV